MASDLIESDTAAPKTETGGLGDKISDLMDQEFGVAPDAFFEGLSKKLGLDIDTLKLSFAKMAGLTEEDAHKKPAVQYLLEGIDFFIQHPLFATTILSLGVEVAKQITDHEHAVVPEKLQNLFTLVGIDEKQGAAIFRESLAKARGEHQDLPHQISYVVGDIVTTLKNHKILAAAAALFGLVDTDPLTLFQSKNPKDVKKRQKAKKKHTAGIATAMRRYDYTLDKTHNEGQASLQALSTYVAKHGEALLLLTESVTAISPNFSRGDNERNFLARQARGSMVATSVQLAAWATQTLTDAKRYEISEGKKHSAILNAWRFAKRNVVDPFVTTVQYCYAATLMNAVLEETTPKTRVNKDGVAEQYYPKVGILKTGMRLINATFGGVFGGIGAVFMGQALPHRRDKAILQNGAQQLTQVLSK